MRGLGAMVWMRAAVAVSVVTVAWAQAAFQPPAARAQARPVPVSGATCPVWSAAVSGQTVVAAGLADIGGQARVVLYVFTEPPGGWSGALNQVAVLAASDGSALGPFAISGGTVVAEGGPTGGLGARQSVYVFTEPPGGWSGTLSESADLGGGSWGSAAISGDTIFASPQASGAVDVFDEPSGGWAGTLQPGAQLTPAGGGPLGVAAASDRTVLAVGPGAAYVFTEPAGGWASENQAARLTVPSGQPGSLAISGQTMVASGNAYYNYNYTGYVFAEPSSGWVDEGPTATLAATGPPRTWRGALRGFSVGKPKLTLKLSTGCTPTESVTISLPRGLAFRTNHRTVARALGVTAAGKLTFTVTRAKLRLYLLNRPVALVELTINPSALIESKALLARVKTHRKPSTLSIGVRIGDIGGNTRLTLKLPAR